MLRFGLLAIGFSLLLASAFSQSSSQIDGTSVLGLWSNAANPTEHFELRADGQFSSVEEGQNFEGTWDLHEKAVTLHYAPFAAGKLLWDGQGFTDNEQKRWVRALPSSNALSQSVAPSSVSTASTPAASSRTAEQKALIEKILLWERLNSQFKITKITADKSDIVTAGSVVVLEKDGLLMYRLDNTILPTTTYKGGKLSMTMGSRMGTNLALALAQPGADLSNVPQRRFVAGEKFWVTAIFVQESNVMFQFYSDPYQ